MTYSSFKGRALRVITLDQLRFACVAGIILSATSCSPKVQQVRKTAVSSIEVQTGVQLPVSTRVLDESADPRSPDYYEWTLFSPGAGRILMPHVHDSTGENYITNTLQVAVQLIETKAKTNVTNAESAFTSYWDKDQYQFRGTVVRTAEGEYLHLERFFRIVNGMVEQKPHG